MNQNVDKNGQNQKPFLVIVVEIFSFTLQMVERDDLEILKDEFKALKSLSDQLDSEVAMFNYQFFGKQWSDQGRRQAEGLLSVESARRDMIQTMENTFDKVQVIGYHGNEDAAEKVNILSKEQFPASGVNAHQNIIECMLVDEFGNRSIVNVQRQPQNTVTMEESSGMNQQYALHEVVPNGAGESLIKHNSKYTLCVSKF